MRHVILTGVVAAVVSITTAIAAAQTAGTSLGSVTLSKAVLADGKPLAAGTYQVRLTGDSPKPGVGQSADGERYVEFVKGGKVIAREVATVVSSADIGDVAKGAKQPGPGASRVEMLKGNEFVRAWLNRQGTHYLIHLPPAS
jgi:hypothetical protein